MIETFGTLYNIFRLVFVKISSSQVLYIVQLPNEEGDMHLVHHDTPCDPILLVNTEPFWYANVHNNIEPFWHAIIILNHSGTHYNTEPR